MTIRNLDEDTFLRLKQRARSNQRSLEAEIRLILDQSARVDRSDLARWSAELRRRLEGRYRGEVTADIRADRDR